MLSTLNVFNNPTFYSDNANIDSIKKRSMKQNTTNKKFEDMLKTSMPSKNSFSQKIDPKKLSKGDKKLYSTCVELESLLWKQVLNEMRKTVNKHNLLNGGQAEKIFTDFLYDEYSMKLAKHSSSKLTDTLYNQLKGNR